MAFVSGRDPVDENGLQEGIIDLAHVLGYIVAHFRPAKTDKGWRTPVGADGKGFPDLVLAHGRKARVIFAELKGTRGVVSAEQRMWLDTLGPAAGWASEAVQVGNHGPLEVYLWTPAEWASGEIERILR